MTEKCSHTNMKGAKTLGDEELNRKRAEEMNIGKTKTSEQTSKTLRMTLLYQWCCKNEKEQGSDESDDKN